MPNWDDDKSDEFNESTPESKAPLPRLQFGIDSEDPVPSSSARYSGLPFGRSNIRLPSSNVPVSSNRYGRSTGQSGSASNNSVRDRSQVKSVPIEKVKITPGVSLSNRAQAIPAKSDSFYQQNKQRQDDDRKKYEFQKKAAHDLRMKQTEEYESQRDQKNKEHKNEEINMQYADLAKPGGLPIKRKQPIIHDDDKIEEISSEAIWIDADADRNPKRGKGLNVKEQRDRNISKQSRGSVVQRNSLEVVNKKRGKAEDHSSAEFESTESSAGSVRSYGRAKPSDTHANRKNDLSSQNRKDMHCQGQRTAKRQKLNSRDGPAEVIDLACEVSSDSEAEREEVDKVKSAKGMRFISNLVAQEAGLLNVSLPRSGDFVKTYTQVHPKIPMKKVYLGRRMFRTSEDGSCSLLLRVQDNKAFLWLDLFEGDSLAATIKSTGKTFSPLGCTSESVLFSDIVQITYGSCPGNNSFIVLLVKDGIQLNNVGVGSGFVLDPTMPVNLRDNPAKYILMITTPTSLHTFVKQVNKLEIRSKINPLINELSDEQVREMLLVDAYPLPGDAAIEALRIKANTEVGMKERALRRKNRPTRAQDMEVDPGDKTTYLVYPVEENAQDAITIYKGDLKRLSCPEYFNDSLIDLRIKYLLNRLPEGKRSKVHAFSCLFYTKLTEVRDRAEGHKMVSRWTKSVDLFDMELVLVPINLDSHWSLVVILRPGLLLHTKRTVEPSSPCSSSSSSSFKKKGQNNMKERDKHRDDPVVDEEGNTPCFLFMDSSSYHAAKRITDNLRFYLEDEYIARKTGKAQDRDRDRHKYKAKERDKDKGKDRNGDEEEKRSDSSARQHGVNAEAGEGDGESASEEQRETQLTSNSFASLSLHVPLSPTTAADVNAADEGAEEEEESGSSCIRASAHTMPTFKCNVPQQVNGYDCGVYVQLFAKYVIDEWPSSTLADHKNRFSKFFQSNKFNEKDVTRERSHYREILENIRVQYDLVREAINKAREAKRREKRELLSATSTSAEGHSTSVSNAPRSVSRATVRSAADEISAAINDAVGANADDEDDEDEVVDDRGVTEVVGSDRKEDVAHADANIEQKDEEKGEGVEEGGGGGDASHPQSLTIHPSHCPDSPPASPSSSSVSLTSVPSSPAIPSKQLSSSSSSSSSPATAARLSDDLYSAPAISSTLFTSNWRRWLASAEVDEDDVGELDVDVDGKESEGETVADDFQQENGSDGEKMREEDADNERGEMDVIEGIVKGYDDDDGSDATQRVDQIDIEETRTQSSVEGSEESAVSVEMKAEDKSSLKSGKRKRDKKSERVTDKEGTVVPLRIEGAASAVSAATTIPPTSSSSSSSSSTSSSSLASPRSTSPLPSPIPLSPPAPATVPVIATSVGDTTATTLSVPRTSTSSSRAQRTDSSSSSSSSLPSPPSSSSSKAPPADDRTTSRASPPSVEERRGQGQGQVQHVASTYQEEDGDGEDLGVVVHCSPPAVCDVPHTNSQSDDKRKSSNCRHSQNNQSHRHNSNNSGNSNSLKKQFTNGRGINNGNGNNTGNGNGGNKSQFPPTDLNNLNIHSSRAKSNANSHSSGSHRKPVSEAFTKKISIAPPTSDSFKSH